MQKNVFDSKTYSMEMADEAIYNKLGKYELTGILIKIIDFQVENSIVLFASFACISTHIHIVCVTYTLLCALLTTWHILNWCDMTY